MGRPSAREQVEGTILVVGAACVFALVALVVKKDPLPVLIATECRFLVSWAVAIAFMLIFRVSRGLHWFGPPELRMWLLLKCALSFVFISLWWTALRFAPVGDCIAIIYTSPIFTSLLSRLLLKELLPPEFPFQVLLVSTGTILVLNPPFMRAFFVAPSGADAQAPSNHTFVFLALAACAVVPLVTKKARDCSWIEVEHVSACLASTVLNPSLLLGQYLISGSLPDTPSAAPGEIGLIILAAGGSFVGIAMETKGYQLADVGKATMIRYIEVPFAFVLQHFGTSDPVEMQAVLGSILILMSCFSGMWRMMVGDAASKTQKLDQVEDALLGS
jgi:drug/metabolite transporter (DMT)-like permease